MSHPSADEMREYITAAADLAANTPQDDPAYAQYHANINAVLDQMDREGGPSHGQH